MRKTPNAGDADAETTGREEGLMQKAIMTLFSSVALFSPLAQAASDEGFSPASASLEVVDIANVPVFQLPRLDMDWLAGKNGSSGPHPLRFAVGLETEVTTANSGLSEMLTDGSSVWRLRFEGRDARNLNFGFTRFSLPPGAELYVYDPAMQFMRGPFTWLDAADSGEFWSPIIPGGSAVIQLFTPAESAFAPDLVIGKVSQGFREFGPDVPLVEDCHVNVTCLVAEDWWDEKRAVGFYSRDGEYGCTGTLVNNLAHDNRNYFLTAQHCGVDASNAATVVVYWNYESTTCDPTSGGDLSQFTSGARFRAGATAEPTLCLSDFTLLELDEPPDPTFDTRYAGWDATGEVPPVGGVSIHHPKGSTDPTNVQKKFSESFDQPLITYSCKEGCASESCWVVEGWEVGTTESGSSGAGVWRKDTERIVGQLLGGSGGICPGGGQNAFFGRLDVSWVGNGTTDTGLEPWLDPYCITDRGSPRVVNSMNPGDHPEGCTTAPEIGVPAAVTLPGSDTRAAPDRGLAWGCVNYGTVWMNDSDGEVYFALLDENTDLVPDSTQRLTSATGESAFPAIAWNGSRYGVVWHDKRHSSYGEIHFELLEADGTPVPGSERRITNDGAYSLYPNVAWSGSHWGLVWNDYRGSGYQVHFQKLNPDGSPNGARKSVTSNSGNSLFPDIVWNGTEYTVAWHDNTTGSYEISFVRLDVDGNKKEAPRQITATDGEGSEYASLAWNGVGYGIAWHDFRDGDWEIYFVELDRFGNIVSGPLNVTADPSAALSASLSWGIGEYGLGWRDDRHGSFETMFTRLDQHGNRIGAVHRVTTSPELSFWVSLAWNGLEFGAVWNEGGADEIDSVNHARIGCCEDADLDGINACPYDAGTNPSGGDCSDDDANTYPGAPEVNDGKDNHCPGDLGFGIVDETTGNSGFHDPLDKHEYSWIAQGGATEYEVARADDPQFSIGCVTIQMFDTYWNDPELPAIGALFHYLNRPIAPNVGSWGQDSTGAERMNICP